MVFGHSNSVITPPKPNTYGQPEDISILPYYGSIFLVNAEEKEKLVKFSDFYILYFPLSFSFQIGALVKNFFDISYVDIIIAQLGAIFNTLAVRPA